MNENNNYLDFAPMISLRYSNAFDEAYRGTPALKKISVYIFMRILYYVHLVKILIITWIGLDQLFFSCMSNTQWYTTAALVLLVTCVRYQS